STIRRGCTDSTELTAKSMGEGMRRAIYLVSAAVLLLAVPCFAADEALIAAAKKEGQVTWYTTQIINQFGRLAIDAFQKRYGIHVDAWRADAAQLGARLMEEAKAGRVQADVYDSTASAPALKKAGVALKWQPDAAKDFPPQLKDPEGYW